MHRHRPGPCSETEKIRIAQFAFLWDSNAGHVPREDRDRRRQSSKLVNLITLRRLGGLIRATYACSESVNSTMPGADATRDERRETRRAYAVDARRDLMRVARDVSTRNSSRVVEKGARSMTSPPPPRLSIGPPPALCPPYPSTYPRFPTPPPQPQLALFFTSPLPLPPPLYFVLRLLTSVVYRLARGGGKVDESQLGFDKLADGHRRVLLLGVPGRVLLRKPIEHPQQLVARKLAEHRRAHSPGRAPRRPRGVPRLDRLSGANDLVVARLDGTPGQPFLRGGEENRAT